MTDKSGSDRKNGSNGLMLLTRGNGAVESRVRRITVEVPPDLRDPSLRWMIRQAPSVMLRYTVDPKKESQMIIDSKNESK